MRGQSIPPTDVDRAYFQDAREVLGDGYVPDYYVSNFVGYMRNAFWDGVEWEKKQQRLRRRRENYAKRKLQRVCVDGRKRGT